MYQRCIFFKSKRWKIIFVIYVLKNTILAFSFILGESKIKPYQLGQDIFYLHRHIDLSHNVKSFFTNGFPIGTVVMDGGIIVLSCFHQMKLIISNIEGSMVDSINLAAFPWDVTAVGISTVAVTFPIKKCIELYDVAAYY